MSTAPVTIRKTTAKRDQATTAEYRQATDSLKFSKDFNTSLEAIMRDPLATWAERFTAWLKRYAWGEYSLYAIDSDGNPRTLAEAAKELSGPMEKVASVKASLSHTARYMQQRNYLRREGKRLYPVVDPQAVPPGPPPQKSCTLRYFSQFLEHWKVAHSATFLELENARALVKTLEKSRLSCYKKWRESQLNEGATLLTKSKEKKKERAGGSVAVVTKAPAPVPDPAPARPPAPPSSSDQTQKPKPNPNPSEAKERPEWHHALELWLNEHGRIGALVDPPMLQKIAINLRRSELLDEFYRQAVKVQNPRKYAVYETIARQVYGRSLVAQRNGPTLDESREAILAQARRILADPESPDHRRKMAQDLLGMTKDPKPRKVRYVDPDTGEIVVLNQSPKPER